MTSDTTARSGRAESVIDECTEFKTPWTDTGDLITDPFTPRG